jgi:hypothetical protein
MPKKKRPGAQVDVPEGSPAIGAVRFSVPLTQRVPAIGIAKSSTEKEDQAFVDAISWWCDQE